MDTKRMNTKEKVIGVAVILPVVLVAAAMAQELWAVFTIVVLFGIAYVFVKQGEDTLEEAIVLEQE